MVLTHVCCFQTPSPPSPPLLEDIPLPEDRGNTLTFPIDHIALAEGFETASSSGFGSPQESGAETPPYDPLWSIVLAEWDSTSEVFDVDVWDPTLDSPPSSPDSLDVAMAGDPLEPIVPVPEDE